MKHDCHDQLTLSQFTYYFKEAVPNFNFAKISISESIEPYEVRIIFVLDNKLQFICLHRSKRAIHLWKNHFIEYFTTGNFDFYSYWQVFTDATLTKPDLIIENTSSVFKFPLPPTELITTSILSDELTQFIKDTKSKHPNCLIVMVPKPFHLINTKKLKKYFIRIPLHDNPTMSSMYETFVCECVTEVDTLELAKKYFISKFAPSVGFEIAEAFWYKWGMEFSEWYCIDDCEIVK